MSEREGTYVVVNSHVSPRNTRVLVGLCNENLPLIAEILNVSHGEIPRNIKLKIDVDGFGESASYCRAEKKIVYRVKSGLDILVDKGRLIHEMVHVVQDYPFNIRKGSPVWCWMEGIADYCRAELDGEFDISSGYPGDPEQGYLAAAHFLSWLAQDFPSVVSRLNYFLKNYGEKISDSNSGHDEIFVNLEGVNKRFSELKVDYYRWRAR